ncbi:MAG: YicC/YloC family endoribonuclease [Alphaproteobacteria bacterium]
MTVNSMTGFARAEGGDDDFTWVWELRSVNGKGLDVRLRLPSAVDAMEQEIRQRLQKRFKRGSVTCSLDLKAVSETSDLVVNEDLLEQLIDTCRTRGETPRIESLLLVRGVVEPRDDRQKAGDDEDRMKAILANFDEAAAGLETARASEGEAVQAALQESLSALSDSLSQAKALADDIPDMISAKLKAQMDKLLADLVPDDRLAQEAALLATKADIREELDRLSAHIDSAGGLLKEDGPVGRKIEFLVQELNRETNTICSKSASIELTEIGLAMKASIDRFREQAANVE